MTKKETNGWHCIISVNYKYYEKNCQAARSIYFTYDNKKKIFSRKGERQDFFFRVNRNIKFSRQIYAHVVFIEGKNTSCASEEIV
jgi:hypothetical protein